MISLFLSPQEIGKQIAQQAKAKRLSFNFSQETLAERSGVSWGTLKKFESSGKISLESLLKIAFVLGCLQDFEILFSQTTKKLPISLDELLKDKSRKRGRS